MFQWYKQAAVCYVTLMDLQPRAQLQVDLPRCRWFTRGWTLQELLAPDIVEFYDVGGACIGSKHSLAEGLASITGVARSDLQGGDLYSISVATRMSWAARRQTKRVEDRAYSMLGIFDVSMPLIYGEGKKAFLRLQEEIIKRNNDLTIFAWGTPLGSDIEQPHLVGPLAPSPAAFELSRISSYPQDFAEFSLTNKGLILSGDVPLRTALKNFGHGKIIVYFIFLGKVNEKPGSLPIANGGIVLRKIGPKLFCRDGYFGIETDLQILRVYEVSETCILLDPNAATRGAQENRWHALRVPLNSFAKLTHTYPEALWDESDRLFLKPQRYSWDGYPMVLVMRFSIAFTHTTVPLAVLCHHPQGRGRVLNIIAQRQSPREFQVVSQEIYREEGMHIHELELQAPGILQFGNTTTTLVGNRYRDISVSLKPTVSQTFAGAVTVSALTFAVDGKDTESMSKRDLDAIIGS